MKPGILGLAGVALLLAACGEQRQLVAPDTRADIVSTAVFDCTAVSQVSQLECQALVALYNSTNGASWTTNTNWLQDDQPCFWHGVNCVNGLLTELLLSDNNLSGTIPAELGNLANLRLLQLPQNQLNGAIPAQLGGLANLQHLLLNHNQLSGAIPAGLGNLSSLRTLSLNTNSLSGAIPSALGSLISLEVLALNENNLTGSIPSELGGLTNLQTLLLQLNQLSKLVPLAVVRLGERLGPDVCNFRPGNDGLYILDTPKIRAFDLDQDHNTCGVGFVSRPPK
jgi:Leucine-rich repeat (LRR) protein